MKWEDVKVEAPKEGEIRVKNKAIGLNFIDVYFRSGIYESALPLIPGSDNLINLLSNLYNYSFLITFFFRQGSRWSSDTSRSWINRYASW